MSPSALRWWRAIVVVGFVNFAVFAAVALTIGGDALNGRHENGRYYVADHGRLTEVSRGVWLYSRAHACSVFVTHPLMLLGFLALSRVPRTQRW